jgi:hypothetical protein
MYGLFNSNGPIYVDDKFGAHRRENPWSLTHSMLYIDSLVGAGREVNDYTLYVKKHNEAQLMIICMKHVIVM